MSKWYEEAFTLMVAAGSAPVLLCGGALRPTQRSPCPRCTSAAADPAPPFLPLLLLLLQGAV